MKKILIIICALCLVNTFSFAQIYSQGRIQFERKTNMKRQLQTEMGEQQNQMMKGMLERMAQFKVSHFTLTFNANESYYNFDEEIKQPGIDFMSMGGGMASENKVAVSFKENQYVAEKKVFENNYLIKDTIQKFTWKIEDEMRIIADYPCRKAVTVIDDSVVVVAFYTTQIMVSGGPEGFGGLPGMILGLAVPRLYTTWFATNVEIGKQTIQNLDAKKGKSMTREEMVKDIKSNTKSMSGGGGFRGFSSLVERILWWAML